MRTPGRFWRGFVLFDRTHGRRLQIPRLVVWANMGCSIQPRATERRPVAHSPSVRTDPAEAPKEARREVREESENSHGVGHPLQPLHFRQVWSSWTRDPQVPWSATRCRSRFGPEVRSSFGPRRRELRGTPSALARSVRGHGTQRPRHGCQGFFSLTWPSVDN